jgi:hypothetical protein
VRPIPRIVKITGDQPRRPNQLLVQKIRRWVEENEWRPEGKREQRRDWKRWSDNGVIVESEVREARVEARVFWGVYGGLLWINLLRQTE